MYLNMTGSAGVGPETTWKASFFAWDWKARMGSSEQHRVLQYGYKTTGTDLWYTTMISPKEFGIETPILEIRPLNVDHFEVDNLGKSQDLRLTIVFIK